MDKAPEKVDTRQHIVTLAEEMIQSLGYNAFSYQDLAEKLEIRKASIHHHFPSKEDLGAEVYDTARLRFEKWTQSLSSSLTALERFDLYVERLSVWAKSKEKICLSGIFSAERNSLPKRMVQKAQAFQLSQKAWVMKFIEDGRKSGQFKRTDSAEDMSLLLLAAVQGSLQMARNYEKPAYYFTVMKQVRAALQA